MRRTSDWFFSPKEDGSGISNSHDPSIQLPGNSPRSPMDIICRDNTVIPRRANLENIVNGAGKGNWIKFFSLFSFFLPFYPRGNLTTWRRMVRARVEFCFIGRGIAWKTLRARDKFLAWLAEKRDEKCVWEREMGDWFKSTRRMINWKVQGPSRMLGRRITTSRIFP